MSCYSEDEIARTALNIIRDNPGITTSGLIKEARKIMNPYGQDTEILNNRNDDKFSQKVRNLKSHNTLANEAYTVGTRNRSWFLKKR